MQLAMNQLATISPGSGYSVLDLTTGVSSPQPQYMALLIDGWAPTTGTDEVECRRRAIVRPRRGPGAVGNAACPSAPIRSARRPFAG